MQGREDRISPISHPHQPCPPPNPLIFPSMSAFTFGSLSVPGELLRKQQVLVSISWGHQFWVQRARVPFSSWVGAWVAQLSPPPPVIAGGQPPGYML